MSRSLPLYIVDAFSSRPFSGNGAAICPVPADQAISSETMQKIAEEMKLSETAFVTPVQAQDTFTNASRFYLRWFTPTCEVNLCGHATLATASTLINVYGNKSEYLEFETLSGTLKAKAHPNGKISIDLPSYECESVTADEFSEVITAVVGKLPVQEVQLSASRKLVVRLKDGLSRQNLEDAKPDFGKLLASKLERQIVGVILTLKGYSDSSCKSDSGDRYDFISRYFAPWLGVNEDPVTGSAHSVSGPYWSKILNKNTLFARQCSPRGGELQIEVKEGRVHLTGDTCVVLQGKITF